MPESLGPDMPPASSRCSRRPTGARKRSGTPAPTTTIQCSTSKAGSGSLPRCAAWTTRASRGSDHPSAKVFPLERSPRQVAMLDPKTMKYTFIRPCSDHHPQFGYDANDTLSLSSSVRWRAGSTPDVRRDRRRGKIAGLVAVHPRYQRQRQARRIRRADQPIDPAGQADRARFRILSVMPSPVDGSIWYTVGTFAGTPGFLRFDPATGLSEIFVPKNGFGIRGGNIDKDGVVWGSLSTVAFASFDRKRAIRRFRPGAMALFCRFRLRIAPEGPRGWPGAHLRGLPPKSCIVPGLQRLAPGGKVAGLNHHRRPVHDGVGGNRSSASKKAPLWAPSARACAPAVSLTPPTRYPGPLPVRLRRSARTFWCGPGSLRSSR